MKKILYIISSPKGDNSFSTKLGNAIVEKLLAANPGSSVFIKDLFKTPIPHVIPDSEESIMHAEQAVAEIKDADIIVIGTPLWNFGIPSVLKARADVIVRPNITFKYVNGGVEGLIRNKTVYVAMASGGIFSQSRLPNQPTLSCRRQAIVSPTTERCLTFREETLLR